MAFKKVSGDAHDFELEKSVEGVYKLKKENVGPNNSKMYYLELEGGKTVAVWGSTALDSQMELVSQGSKVKITFLGEVPSPNRPGKTYKNFQVEVWEEEEMPSF